MKSSIYYPIPHLAIMYHNSYSIDKNYPRGFTCICVVCVSHSVISDSLRLYGLQPASLLCPWDSSGKNTGVDCHAVLQGIFPTQESNLHLVRLLR